MPVRVHARRRVMVIAASGELDLVSVALLEAAVDSALAGSWPLITVDMAELQFLDVVGARPLVRLARCLPSDRQVVIVNVSAGVAPVLHWLGLSALLVAVEELPIATDHELAALLSD